jgi:hypothetical protein
MLHVSKICTVLVNVIFASNVLILSIYILCWWLTDLYQGVFYFRHALPLFTSLLNIVCSYDPVQKSNQNIPNLVGILFSFYSLMRIVSWEQQKKLKNHFKTRWTIDGRNLIFAHKLYIGTPYRGKHCLTRQIPTSCLPKSGGIIGEH